jgi:sulfur carrier protein
VPAREFDVQVNGTPRRVSDGCTVESLLRLVGVSGARIAVAVNREVVPRSAFSSRRLAVGDRVEILEAVGGG